MEELTKYLKALVLIELGRLQESERAGKTGPKAELLLADAGFSHKEISEMLGKSAGAVAKAVSRARAAKKIQMSEESGGANAGKE
jgi:DNA-directed RNA polymerase specialized sigma24 family protein